MLTTYDSIKYLDGQINTIFNHRDFGLSKIMINLEHNWTETAEGLKQQDASIIANVFGDYPDTKTILL